MRVEVIRPVELSYADLDRWRAIQSADSELRSPYFAPEFCRAVGEERDDAFVAVIDDLAFLPFHRVSASTGAPIGLRLSDYQGIVATATPEFAAAELVARCDLSRWDFRCVPAAQRIFDPWRTTMLPTASIDLSAGFDRPVKKQAVPLRFTWHTGNPGALTSLLDCKSAQYRRTGINDVFAAPWIVGLLHRLHAGADPGCQGVLSQLHAGDQLMAAHFGIRSVTVLHYWFPCYNPAFARCSPGHLLLQEIARHAPGEGIARIDLGLAGTPYKGRFANTRGSVIRGSVIANS